MSDNAQPDEEAAGRRRFEDDLEVREEVVPADDEPLPPGVTHEVEEEGGERTVRRRRFSAN